MFVFLSTKSINKNLNDVNEVNILKSQYYWTCPNCGANLDPGESCDCKRNEDEKSDFLIAQCTPVSSELSGIVDNLQSCDRGCK